MQAMVYLWNKAPFIRFLIYLIAGIILQRHLEVSLIFLAILFGIFWAAILVYSFLPLASKYKFSFANGISTSLLFLLMGSILVWINDTRHLPNWIGHYYKDSCNLVVTIQEPLIAKPNSFKALASLECMYDKKICRVANGKIILYFKKDSAVHQLHYGKQLIFNKALQEIKNANNPGSFDYKKYSLFQGITHQVYLLSNDYIVLPVEKNNYFDEFIFKCRSWVVGTLKKYIPGKKELGLAEALLIGYKDDLDKSLVQSYSNTGVVHVIAISGLHLGLIYGLLLFLTKPMKRRKQFNWLRLFFILLSLWLFSILAGGQPSVLRSALMFSFLATSEVLSRKTSIYNTLALSAFILLCINPFWLWDVGFQLSYSAVLSIIIFFRPVYNWFFLPNKIADFFWKLIAVTIAAQLLTLPISIYHFHQLPTLFLFTNLVAVPLSGIILMGEIALCSLFFFESFAKIIGLVLEKLIQFMNGYIELLDGVAFSVWKNLSVDLLQTILLSVIVLGFCYWLMENKKIFLWWSCLFAFCFMAVRSVSFINCSRQKKIIVYNIPRHTAIDLISRRTYSFIGDSSLLFDDFQRSFHLHPSRILHRVETSQRLPYNSKDLEFCSKRIVIIDSVFRFAQLEPKLVIDFLVLSGNPKLYLTSLNKSFIIHQIIIDGSVPAWKAKLWKKDCDSLHIPYFDVTEKGAFVMNL